MNQKSWELAGQLVRSEVRLEWLVAMNAPDLVIQEEKKILAKRQAKVDKDPVAISLMDRARKFEKTLSERGDIIRKHTNLSNLSQALHDFELELRGITKETKAEFHGEEALAAWNHFRTAVLGSDRAGIVEAISRMLIPIEVDVLHLNMPALEWPTDD